MSHPSGGEKYHRFFLERYFFEVETRYTQLKLIGVGSYGTVCSAYDTVTKQKVAIKKIQQAFKDLLDAKRTLREIKLLRHFRESYCTKQDGYIREGHDNIIKILDIRTMPPNRMDFSDIYIVADLMESDFDRIIASRQPLTNEHYQYFLYQILRGLKYIHSANVLHRDLKPSNILVNADCDLAICDFGLARGVEEGYNGELTEYVVTRWYRAPELLLSSDTYDSSVDVWAVGCIFAEMLHRKAFFKGQNPVDQLRAIMRVLGTPSEEELTFVCNDAARKILRECRRYPPQPLARFFAGADPLAVDLLSKMLIFDPRKRISVDDALRHPYLASLYNEADDPVCPKEFNFDFEYSCNGSKGLSEAEIRRMIYSEMLRYHPEEMIDVDMGDCDQVCYS